MFDALTGACALPADVLTTDASTLPLDSVFNDFASVDAVFNDFTSVAGVFTDFDSVDAVFKRILTGLPVLARFIDVLVLVRFTAALRGATSSLCSPVAVESDASDLVLSKFVCCVVSSGVALEDVEPRLDCANGLLVPESELVLFLLSNDD